MYLYSCYSAYPVLRYSLTFMIVTQTDTGWQIINQQAHGLLAVQIALHWQVDKRPVHWVETLIALTEHDDGQDNWEGRNHLTTAGAPLHFPDSAIFGRAV